MGLSKIPTEPFHKAEAMSVPNFAQCKKDCATGAVAQRPVDSRHELQLKSQIEKEVSARARDGDRESGRRSDFHARLRFWFAHHPVWKLVHMLLW